MSPKIKQKIFFHIKSFSLAGVKQTVTGIRFLLPDNMEPKELHNIEPPRVDGRKGIVLSGRGPIWLYGYMVHHFHPHPWVATYERRENAAIIFESHVPGIAPGDILPLPDEVVNFFEKDYSERTATD